MPKTAVLSRTADVARGALMAYARPRLAQDAVIDLTPILKGANSKNLKGKSKTIAAAFDAAVRPKLAQDADLDQADVAAVIEEVAEVMKDESDSIAAAVADPVVDPDATDAGASWSEVESFLQGKISDEDLAELRKLFKGDDEGSAEDARQRRRAAPPAAQDKDKNMVSKTAMDAALAEAEKRAEDRATANAMRLHREIRDAENFVRPYSGNLAIACDSAEAVYRAACDVLKIDHQGKHVDALPTIIEVVGKAKDPSAKTRFAQDTAPAGITYDVKNFPHMNRLK